MNGLANIFRQIQDGRECIIVENTGNWAAYQAAMVLRQQPEGLLVAFSSDPASWIGYIRADLSSLADVEQMPESSEILAGLRKIFETADCLLLDPAGFPADPRLWFYTDTGLSCVYIPQTREETDLQDPEEKIAYMLLTTAIQKKSPQEEVGVYYRHYLEAAGVLQTAEEAPEELFAESLPDLLGEDFDIPITEKRGQRRGFFRRREKKRK